jgi:3-oxoadipate enol-lactonase
MSDPLAVGPAAAGPAAVALAHRVDGPDDAPAVLLAPSLGTTWEMWDWLAADLSETYRVVRLDTRGHGRSPAPPGPYTVDALAADVVALADRLSIERFGFVGLSLGGAVGQVLCSSYGERVGAAVLCCTVPRFGEPSTWLERAAMVRAEGMEALAEPTRGRWFTDAFRAEHPREVDRFIAMLTGVAAEGYAACCEALAGFDAWPLLGGIVVPVRVVAGSADPVCPPDACREMAAAVPGADVVVVPDASHIASAEQPEAFRRAVTDHLGRHL